MTAGVSVRFVMPYRMQVYDRPLKLSWALFFDNHMGTFCLRHSYRSRGFYSSQNGASWIGKDGIEQAIRGTRWLDARQKGRAIRKARRIAKFLVPVERQPEAEA